MTTGNRGGGHVRVVGVGGTMRPGSSSLAALRRSLGAAEAAGARTELLDLRHLRLPTYEPDIPLEEYGDNVRRFVGALRTADALLVSTAAYHGTVAGATRNALDFLEFLAADDPPYLDGKTVGLIATAAGGQAAPNAIAALVQTAHALRAVVAPFSVPIPGSWPVADGDEIAAGRYDRRLDDLGRMVVDLARKLRGDTGLAGARAEEGRTAMSDDPVSGPTGSLAGVPGAVLVQNGWVHPESASACT